MGAVHEEHPRLTAISMTPHRLLPLFLVTAATTLLQACGDLCGNEQISEHPSPDRSRKVVVFRRDCGATTGWSIHASLLKADAVLGTDGGNVFVADDPQGPPEKGTSASPAVRVEWVRPKVLQLDVRAAGEVFTAAPEHDGVTIQYVGLR